MIAKPIFLDQEFKSLWRGYLTGDFFFFNEHKCENDNFDYLLISSKPKILITKFQKYKLKCCVFMLWRLNNLYIQRRKKKLFPLLV